MGLTYVKMTISSLTKRKGKEVQHRFLIDSGAVFSVVPEEILKKLGIRPEREEEFDLANGEVVTRKVGNARVTYGNRSAASPVIFGEKGDSSLLGVVTLENLGLSLDPLKRELKLVRFRLG